MPAIVAVERAAGVAANEVAGNEVVASRVHENAVQVEAIDAQTAHRAVAAGDFETVGLRTRVAAVKFDEDNRIVAIGLRIGSGARLRVAINGHSLGDGGQRRSGRDGVKTRAGNRENDAVGSRRGIGIVECLAQAARTSVIGVGNGKRRRLCGLRGRAQQHAAQQKTKRRKRETLHKYTSANVQGIIHPNLSSDYHIAAPCAFDNRVLR